MEMILTRKGEHMVDDEHAVHEVRAYDVHDRLLFQQVATPGSKAQALGLDWYQSNRVIRIVIRCIFPIWPKSWLIKSILCRGKAVNLPEGLEITDYRIVYYGADDFVAETVDMDERPCNQAIRDYLHRHRHCPYAVVLGQGVILDTLENPEFRVQKTITALHDKSANRDVQAYLNTSFVENAARLAQEFKIESSINSVRNLGAQRMWNTEPPQIAGAVADLVHGCQTPQENMGGPKSKKKQGGR